jgi:invasion protein IalB
MNCGESIAMKNILSIAAAGVALVIGISLAGAAEIPTRTETTAAAKSTKQVIGDWVLSCAPAANGHNACVMSQTLASQKLKKTISVLSIGRDRAGKLTGSLRMPIGVSLPAGVVVGIANKDPFTIPYTACHRIGCFAPFDVTEPLLGQIRKSTKITVVAQSVSKQALNLNFSTRGFSDAYAAYVAESK